MSDRNYPITHYKWVKANSEQESEDNKKYLLEHGYAHQATWETHEWLRVFLLDICKYYRDEADGSPIFDDAESDEIVWKDILNQMIFHLERMNEEFEEYREDLDFMINQREYHKNEFFKLFSKYFFFFWD